MADHSTGHAVLTSMTPHGPGANHALDRPIHVLGRGEHCDITLSGAGVAGTHAAVIRCADGWYIGDLGGLGDTRVNSVVCRWRRLRPGDELSLGRTRFRFDGPPTTSAAGSSVSAVLVNVANGARWVAPEPMVLIGSAWFCDCVVRDVDVSPVEAFLAWTASGPMLRGLSEAARVTRNGQPMIEAALNEGDRISVGSQVWRFETAASRDAKAVHAPAMSLQSPPQKLPTTIPAPLTLSRGILDSVDDDDLKNLAPHYRAGLVRLDGMTHVDRLERLVAARLPADLRSGPILATSAEEAPSKETPVLIDEQMSRDLARLERVQEELTTTARQVADSSRLEDWEQRQAEFNIRRGELRDERQSLDAERSELRQRADEIERVERELAVARREAEHEQRAVEEESTRLADRARLLADTQSQVDRMAAALDAERFRLAEHATLIESRVATALRQAAELSSRRAMQMQRRHRLRDAWRRRREAWVRASAQTAAASSSLAEREAELRRRVASLDAESLTQRDAWSQHEDELAVRSAAIQRREERLVEREARLLEREQSAVNESAKIDERRVELDRRCDEIRVEQERMQSLAAELAQREQSLVESLASVEAQLAQSEDNAAAVAERENRLLEREQSAVNESAKIDERRVELDRRCDEIRIEQERMQSLASELAQREQALAESLASVEAQLAQSEDNAAAVADREADLDQRLERVRTAETELTRQAEALERAGEALEQVRRELELRGNEITSREAAAAGHEARIDASRIQLKQDADALFSQREELNRRTESLTTREAAVAGAEERADQVAEESRRMAEREAVLRRDAEAYEARVGELVRQREQLESERAAVLDEARTQERQRIELEQNVSDRLNALEAELAARRREVEAALEARRLEVEAALESARQELNERGESMAIERAAVLAQRQQLDADRAAADLRSVIGELSPPRRRADSNEFVPTESILEADIESRQAALDARAEAVEALARRLEDDRSRFVALQAEFDDQQRAWAEQREQTTALLERQRSDLAETQRRLESQQPLPSMPQKPMTANVPRVPLSGKSVAWIAAATFAGLAIGYYWPSSQSTLYAEIQLESLTHAAAMRDAERDLWQPDLLRAAAARAGTAPDAYEQLWQSEQLESQIEPRHRRIVLTARVPAAQVEQSRGLLDALTAEYRERHQSSASSQPDEDAASWRERRDDMQRSLEKIERAAVQAEAALAEDQTESRRRALQVKLTDAKSQYDKARADAEQTMQAAARVQQLTADDAARVIDTGQLDAALAADGMYAVDSEQLRGQSLALQSMLIEADKPVGGLLAQTLPAVEAAEKVVSESGQSTTQSDVVESLEKIRRQLTEHKAQMVRFGDDWTAQQSIVRAWKAGQSVESLLQVQRTLAEKHEALARQGLARLDVIRTSIESLLNESTDTARRDVLQSTLFRAFRPVQENYAELVQATSGVSGVYYPRIEAARHAVANLSARLRDRRGVVEAELARQIRENWNAQHAARVTRVQHIAQEAAGRRDRLSEELGELQDQLAALLARDAGLDARRRDAQSRREEADRLKKQIADIDEKISTPTLLAAGKHSQISVSPAIERPVPAATRLWRALLTGGIVAIAGWLVIPVFQIGRMLRATPRTLRTGTES